MLNRQQNSPTGQLWPCATGRVNAEMLADYCSGSLGSSSVDASGDVLLRVVARLSTARASLQHRLRCLYADGMPGLESADLSGQ